MQKYAITIESVVYELRIKIPELRFLRLSLFFCRFLVFIVRHRSEFAISVLRHFG